MKILLSIIAFLILTTSIAQKEKVFSKEFSMMLDNDAFMLKLKDGYYTNGVFLQLSKAYQQENIKKIRRFELGQTMFTTGDRRAVLRNEEAIDRPYCGYLYLKLTNEKMLTDKGIFSWNASFGATGRMSLAQQLQDTYHKIIHLYPYPYWETQIPNAVGINGGINYKTTIAENSFTKLVANTEANVGMFYTNAKLGSYLCIGAFEKNSNSALFNTRINSTAANFKRKYELFLYAYPQLILQGYNATLQGTLFYNKGNAITSNPNTLMYQQSFGVVCATKRWTGKFETNFQTKETSLQNRQNRYGSLQFCYRFN